MGFIDGFYTVEARAKEQALRGADLLAYRKAHAGPIAKRFRLWLGAHLDDLLPTNPVRKAMKYYVNHWDALTHSLSDPLVELDNNWSERALRKVALLRPRGRDVAGHEAPQGGSPVRMVQPPPSVVMSQSASKTELPSVRR